MIAPFLELPSAEEYPEYYDVIESPISIAEVSTRLRSKHYGTLQALLDDLDVMWRNAMTFNEPASDIYKDAVALQKLTRQTMVKLITDNSSSAAPSKPSPSQGAKRPKIEPPKEEEEPLLVLDNVDEKTVNSERENFTATIRALVQAALLRDGADLIFQRKHYFLSSNTFTFVSQSDMSSHFPSTQTMQLVMRAGGYAHNGWHGVHINGKSIPALREQMQKLLLHTDNGDEDAELRLWGTADEYQAWLRKNKARWSRQRAERKAGGPKTERRTKASTTAQHASLPQSHQSATLNSRDGAGIVPSDAFTVHHEVWCLYVSFLS
jgi:hypothetical protein